MHDFETGLTQYRQLDVYRAYPGHSALAIAHVAVTVSYIYVNLKWQQNVTVFINKQ